MLLGALAESPERGVGLLPAAHGPNRHQARDLLAVAGDYHLFAPLYEIEQLAEFVLRLEGTNFTHVVS
jgi:hypothetical protein